MASSSAVNPRIILGRPLGSGRCSVSGNGLKEKPVISSQQLLLTSFFFFPSGLLVEYGPVLGLWGVVRVGGRKQFLTGLGQFSAIGTYSELSGRPWTGFKSRFIPQDCRTCLKARGQRWDGVRLYHQVSVGTFSLALKHCLRWWKLLPKGRANSHDALRKNW